MPKMRLVTHFCLIVCLAMGSSAAFAQSNDDRSAVQRLISELLDAFVADNAQAMARPFAAKAPGLESIPGWVKDFAATRNLKISDLSLTRWKLESESGSMRVGFHLEWSDAQTQNPARADLLWNVQLVKQDGSWRLWQTSQASHDLLQASVQADTEEHARRMLEEDPAPITVNVIFDVLNQALDIAKEKKADGTIAISKEIELAGFAIPYWNKRQASKFNLAHRLIAVALSAATVIQNEAAQGWANVYDSYVAGMALKRSEQLTSAQEALRLFKKSQDHRGEAAAVTSLGDVYRDTGRYSEALESYQAALAIARAGDQKDAVAFALQNVGDAHVALGQYAEASPAYTQALAVLREQKMRKQEGDLLVALGRFYRFTGRYDDAMQAYRAAAAIAVEVNKEVLGAEAAQGVGELFQLQGRSGDALKAYKESAIVFAMYERPAEQMEVMNRCAAIYISSGKYEAAALLLDFVLRDSQKHGDKASYTEGLIRMAELDFARGKPDDALGHYDEALKAAAPLGDSLNLLRAFSGKGDVYRARRRWSDAVAAYRSAIQQVELLRAQTKEQSLQTSFFSQFTAPYSHLVESLLEANAPGAIEQAFQAGERAKARTLVELMDSGRVNVDKSMSEEERARDRQLDARVTSLSVQLREGRAHAGIAGSDLEKLSRELTAAQSDYDAFRRQLFLIHPELQVKRAQFSPATLSAVQHSVFGAHPETAVLSYVVSNDATILFVLLPGGKGHSGATLRIHRIAINRKELGEKVEDLRLACVSGRGHTSRGLLVSGDQLDYRPTARALYDILVAPAEADLRGAKHVIVIPDAALHALPFQVLLDGKLKHWIEKQALSYAPSVTALLKMIETRPSASSKGGAIPLLAVGRPDFRGQLHDLPATEAEVKAIATLFSVTPLLGKDATKKNLQEPMKHARYLHLATHGLINEAAPMYSAIALTRGENDDGLLTARELINLDLASELAVLSACETALGKQTSGEGVLGLTWALFSAGVRGTVVTQWSVEDASTSTLMTSFYTRLRQSANTNKAEALRQAQLSLLQDVRYAHPFYWAPFVLVGAWE